MMRDTLTGGRIRERRILAGMKQADLARRAGISASYLNLIEHNRRRIGGKLLLGIAEALGVEPSILTEGAEAALIANLREAASDTTQVSAELDRVDEFAGRFPGWAELLARDRKRIDTLESTVKILTDRLTHDPHLAASLHDMLTTVTAIRSAASILAESGDIEPEWQDRFHRNINEDSARLAETSQALVRYLDDAEDATADVHAPQEEVDAILARNGYHFDQMEAGLSLPHDVANAEGVGLSSVARRLFMRVLEQFAQDIAVLPKEKVIAGIKAEGVEPFVLANLWGVDPALAMRRIAALATAAGAEPVGFAVCDASGALVYRQPLDSFPLARLGSGCPMLPLYRALASPLLPVAAVVQPTERDEDVFTAFAYAHPFGPLRANEPQLVFSSMLVASRAGQPNHAAPLKVGVNCRICPRQGCVGRREPSILSRGM